MNFKHRLLDLEENRQEYKAGSGFLVKQIKSLSLMDENRRPHMYAGADYSSGGVGSFTVNL